MRQIAATGRRGRLLQQIASFDMWKSLSLRSVAQIQTGLNLCDTSQRQTELKRLVAAAMQTRRLVAAICRIVCLGLRLVFTSDGVVVGVVIRRVERYGLVKIKPTESEAEHWFCLCLRCLRSSENWIVVVASRRGRINQWQCSIPDLAIGLFFRFCFWFRQPSFHWIISDGVVNGIGRNGNVLILPTPIPSILWLCLRLRFSIFTRS